MTVTGVYDSPVVWTPSAGSFAARAISDPGWFWGAAADDVGLQWMKPYETVLDLSDGPAFPHFFRGGQLNWADYAVDRWVRVGRGDHEAIWWEGDDGESSTLTYAELKAEVDRAAGRSTRSAYMKATSSGCCC